VADAGMIGTLIYIKFQSPSRGGHLRGPVGRAQNRDRIGFQSPSRGGHLRGFARAGRRAAALSSFSPLHEGDTSVAEFSALCSAAITEFQSPSRGGHLRGSAVRTAAPVGPPSFSPLHEGDTSVAHRTGRP